MPSLSVEVARALCHFEGESLVLNVEQPSQDLADELTNFRGGILRVHCPAHVRGVEEFRAAVEDALGARVIASLVPTSDSASVFTIH